MIYRVGCVSHDQPYNVLSLTFYHVLWYNSMKSKSLRFCLGAITSKLEASCAGGKAELKMMVRVGAQNPSQYKSR